MLGESGVVELTLLVGYYTLTSFTLNTFQVPAGSAGGRSDRVQQPAVHRDGLPGDVAGDSGA